MQNTDDTPLLLAIIQYPSTPLLVGNAFKNLPLLKGMIITQLHFSSNMGAKEQGERRKPTKSERKAAMIIPWINEVVEVGEVLSAHEIIGRLTDANGPVRRLGDEPSRGVYRNLKHLPNAAGLSYLLRVSKHYERVLSQNVTTWKRVK